jgi:hypothetical protein
MVAARRADAFISVQIILGTEYCDALDYLTARRASRSRGPSAARSRQSAPSARACRASPRAWHLRRASCARPKHLDEVVRDRRRPLKRGHNSRRKGRPAGAARFDGPNRLESRVPFGSPRPLARGRGFFPELSSGASRARVSLRSRCLSLSPNAPLELRATTSS